MIQQLMIPNFGQTVQQDIVDIYAIVAKTPEQVRALTPDQRQTEIALGILCGVRLAATGIMGSGILYTASVIPFLLSAPVSSLITTAIGVGIFVMGRDFFVMAKNISDGIQNPTHAAVNLLQGLGREAMGFFVQRHLFGNGINSVITNGTILNVLWTNMLTAATRAQ
ncbi:MAG: hypothetical protein LW832_09310 [Parachlamydia sp.]|jgi:hypothetical protein|nr:hypothetical protein [Parachlamydia sp.]